LRSCNSSADRLAGAAAAIDARGRFLYASLEDCGADALAPRGFWKNLAAFGRDRAKEVVSVAIQVRKGFLGKGIARYGRSVWIRGVAAAVASLVLAGCATTGRVTAESPPAEKQAAVTERAKARWQAIIDGDVEKAYGFLSPGSKALTSIERYRSRARLTGFRAADVESVACETESCKVNVRVTLDHRLMKGLQVPVEETWVLDNGQYWYVWRL
jgi:hypothetical protein